MSVAVWRVKGVQRRLVLALDIWKSKVRLKTSLSRNPIVPECEEDGLVFVASFQVSILHHSGPRTIYAQRIEHGAENY